MLFFEYGIAMAPQRETCSESLNSKEVTENSLDSAWRTRCKIDHSLLGVNFLIGNFNSNGAM